VPDLQAWLREQRQLTVCALLRGPLTKEDLAPRLEISPQRVADIASGHGRTKAKRTKPAARPPGADRASDRITPRALKNTPDAPDTEFLGKPMKRNTIMQIRAAALVAVPSMVLVAAVITAGTAQAAPLDSSPGVGSNDRVRVNFWQGISITDESGDF
jgi:hypothetical protein